jgi:hypothetical protein
VTAPTSTAITIDDEANRGQRAKEKPGTKELTLDDKAALFYQSGDHPRLYLYKQWRWTYSVLDKKSGTAKVFPSPVDMQLCSTGPSPSSCFGVLPFQERRGCAVPQIGKNRFILRKRGDIPMKLMLMKRKGITPIVVTFLLIIVTLMASVILGGMVFGFMGSYAPPAEVTVESATCSSNLNAITCSITLGNLGGHSTATSGFCTLGSGSNNATLIGGGVIPAGGSLSGVKCVRQGVDLTQGSSIEGSLYLTNGAVLTFYGSSS